MQDDRLKWWDLPLRVLAMGVVILLLVGAPIYVFRDRLPSFNSTPPEQNWLLFLTAILVLGVGVGIALFLWWLTDRFFRLVTNTNLTTESLVALKDLPMGLPEGTVRAVLALIVAVIGIPLLLFSSILRLEQPIAGYINGIITGVFAFYFGTRVAAGNVSAQAVDKIAGAQQQALAKAEDAATSKAQAVQAQAEADNAKAEAATAHGEAVTAKEQLAQANTDADVVKQQLVTAQQDVQNAQAATGFDSTLSEATRHIALAQTILQTFGPALPPGILPPEAANVLNNAQSVVAALQGVTAGNATPDQVTQLAQAVTDLTGKNSPLGNIFNTAAPLLTSVVPIAGLGPAGALAALLALGVRLGSSQFQRWRARVLSAPLAQGLVEFGTLTPELISAALRNAPLLRTALASVPANQIGLLLSNILSAPDATQQLLAAFGPSGTTQAGLISNADDAGRGLEELRHAVLALYSANDVQDSTVQDATNALTSATQPDISGSDVQTALKSLSAAGLNSLIDNVAGISTRPGGTEQQRAAFDALVTLVDTARRQQIDLGTAIAELHQ
ncbi:hypothetical protein [Paraburkholderia terrae]|uniref:hypothetical protein n=1 Tax=Paraburkholderia terrae TaxID=311230 RepID=UPI002049AE9E|nr:hypothetical protein [Paraburkholderia terrae]BDC46008.1 hypothetical protein PTKU15_93050 [Paraburkholderia terrae]